MTVCDDVLIAAVFVYRVESCDTVIAILCLIFSQFGCEVLQVWSGNLANQGSLNFRVVF